MSSAEEDVLIFDVPTTDADREALRRARNPTFASFEDYLRWLSTLPVDMEALAARKLPIGHRPFSLFDPVPVVDGPVDDGSVDDGTDPR